MAKGLLVTLIRIFWHQDGTSGFWNGESISIFFPGKIITPQGYDTSFLLSAHGMAHGMTRVLWRGSICLADRARWDRLLFRRRALLSMLSCRVGTPDPISVRPPPASSPPRPIKLFAFVKFVSLIVAFDCLKNILVVVYIRESCCWLFETV